MATAEVEVILPKNSSNHQDSQHSSSKITWELLQMDNLPQKPLFGKLGKGFTDKLLTGILKFKPPGQRLECPMVIILNHAPVLNDSTREINVYQTETADNSMWNKHEDKTTEESKNGDDTRERTLIFLNTVPAYLAVLNQVHTECRLIGKEGGSIMSSVYPGVQIMFDKGCLVKEIQVGLSVETVSQAVVPQVLGHTKVQFSPFVMLKPTRRKFHKQVKVRIPMPGQDSMKPCVQASTSLALPTTVRLLTSITMEHEMPVWEDITEKVNLVPEKGFLTFETTVTARFCLVHVDPGEDVDLAGVTQKIYNHIS